jgi:hypothetical protein
MNHQAMEALCNERLKDIEHIINIQSADDPDMKQEGLLAAYMALRSQPTATDRYLLNKSQWEMVDSVRKGKSVDNGFYKRKDLKIIHYDQLPSGEGVFSAVYGSTHMNPSMNRRYSESTLQGSLRSYHATSGHLSGSK